jgi:hypothetical protein
MPSIFFIFCKKRKCIRTRRLQLCVKVSLLDFHASLRITTSNRLLGSYNRHAYMVLWCLRNLFSSLADRVFALKEIDFSVVTLMGGMEYIIITSRKYSSSCNVRSSLADNIMKNHISSILCYSS